MPTLTVDLPDHLARLVAEAVARGDYATPDQAVADALCILQYEAATHGEKLAILRREVRKGIVDADAGRISPFSIEDIARRVASRDDHAA